MSQRDYELFCSLLLSLSTPVTASGVIGGLSQGVKNVAAGGPLANTLKK